MADIMETFVGVKNRISVETITESISGKISKQVGCISCFTHGVWEIPFIYRFSKLMLEDDTLRETRDFSIAIVISLLVLLMKDQVTNLQNFIVESVT